MMIKPLHFLLALAALLPSSIAEPTRYDNQLVIRVPNSPALLNSFNELNLDVWSVSQTYIDVRLSKSQLRELSRKESEFSAVKYTVLDSDLQTTVERERRRLTQLPAVSESALVDSASADFFSDYHKYDEIKQWMRKLQLHYSDLVKYVPSIGKSVEGRDIMQMRITSSKGDKAAKKRVWLQSMQHCREWISGATTLYFANTLVTKYGKDPRVTNVMDQVEFVITPVANPDGYVYTWTTDRMWRKNRGVKDRDTVFGVDLNRNWPDHWGTVGSSSSPRDNTYRGPSPASEPEVKALMRSFLNTPNVLGAIDFHSYSQVIMRPYAYNDDVSPDDAEFLALHKSMKEEAAKNRGIDYGLLTKLYPVSGGARDWFYGEGTPMGNTKNYGMTIELGPDSDDTNKWGFVLPPQEIVKVGEDMVPAVLKLAEWVIEKPLGKKTSKDVK